MVQLIAVSTSSPFLLRRFISLPWMIHREHAPNPYWVPPLRMERREFLSPQKNPFFDHARCRMWLAVNEEGKDVGRIAAIIDEDWQRYRNDPAGFFGLFECIQDPEVAHALVEHASAWLRDHGCERVIGPMNLAMHQEFGLLVDNFDRVPSFNMPYNPPYYASLLEGQGLSKIKDVYQWGLSASTPVPERIARIAQRIQERENIRFRNFDFSNWDRDVEICLRLYNDAWRDNWGFVPVTIREFSHMAKDLKLVLEPSLGLFLEVNGEEVAFSVTVKDLNPIFQRIDGKLFPSGLARLIWDAKIRPKVRGARLMLLGLREDYRRRGLDSVLYVETIKAARKLGYENGQIGWTLEDNALVNRAIQSMGGHKIATYRLYERSLQTSEAQAQV